MENEKNFSKKNIFILTGLIIVIIAIISILIFSGNSSLNFDDTKNISENYTLAHPRADKPIVYIKNGGLYVKKHDGSGEATELSSNLFKSEVIKNASLYIGLVTHSKTSDALYFVKDYSDTEYTGTLCITTDYKTVNEIDTNIAYETDDNGGNRKIALSSDGKTVVYMKNLKKTTDQLYADLYYKNIDADPISIADSLQGFATQYIISSNGEYIAAYSEYDNDQKNGGFYLLKNGEVAKNLVPENEKSILLKGITDDGKLIYSSVITDAAGNKLKDCVTFINYETMERKVYGENIDRGNIFLSDKSDKIVYIENNESSFSAYRASFNDELVLITDKYYGFTALDVENECYSFAVASGDETYAADKKIYVKTPDLKKAELLCEKIQLPSDVKFSADYKQVYFLSEGKLFFLEISDGTFTEKEQIAENVKDFKISQGGNSVVFVSNYNEEDKTADLNAYTKEGKKIINITSKTALDHYTLSVDGLSVIYSDELSNEPNKAFNAKLYKYDLYGKNKNALINDNASMMFYYYDQYLASTSQDSVFARNKYNVRSSNNILYFTEIGTDCVSGKLNLYSNGKTTLVDENVMTVLFE